MVAVGRRSGFLMGFGACFVVVGAIMVVFWPPLFFGQLKKMMILTPTSESYDVWKETPIPMFLECFMFNVTNTEDILAGHQVLLKVEQLGPYVFRETHSKTNITWNDNGTVTFYNQRFWHFEPDMSNGTLTDVITSINPVIATVAYFMRYERSLLKIPVDLFLKTQHEHMFLAAPVSAWLFDGISDPVLEIASHFPNLPLNIPYDKFGWFYDRNGSMEYDGVFVMNTGADEFSNLGNIELWKNSNRTVFRDDCGAVKGSTGELWAPELGQPEVTIFAPDICTFMNLAKNDTVEVEGIEGVLYVANSSIFDNGYEFPQMACYCDSVRDSDCLPPGALNVSLCRFGAPAFVTLPHMLNSDPYYPSKIDGLNPTEDHTFRLALEMFTGIPLQVAAQLQINLLVRHVDRITINNVLPDADTLVPMFWFRQEVRITPEYAAMARFALNVRYGMPYGLYALTVVGVVLLLSGIVILVRKILRSPDTTPILSATGSSEHLH